MAPIIEAKHIGKKYSIDHQRGRYVALRDIVTNTLKAPFDVMKARLQRSVGLARKEEFWALRDINFSIEQGDAIGIIGRNGAGKSTLLKILSQITPPTTGEIRMHGRVGSLLEVGTGFHPELTGRENIFLNGAILGMTRKEIARKFDEIVTFAGVEKFLDTPVKHYSSGMHVRLAFSVAAHMEPDILIVDEVLAVGDTEFQKKCLGKMDEIIKKQKRTILFVSHNMSTIEQLCQKVIILDKGKIVFTGPTADGVSFYLKSGTGLQREKSWSELQAKKPIRLLRTFLHDENGTIQDAFDVTKKIGVTFEYEVVEPDLSFIHGIELISEEGSHVLSSYDVRSNSYTEKRKPGRYSATVWISENMLTEGTFSVKITAFRPDQLEYYVDAIDALRFQVIDHKRGDSALGTYLGRYPGIVRPKLDWETKTISSSNYPS